MEDKRRRRGGGSPGGVAQERESHGPLTGRGPSPSPSKAPASMGRDPASAAPAPILLSPPHMGPHERRLLMDAFDSNWIAPAGPHLEAFEEEFAKRLGVPHAVALSSGTAAIHLALHLLGVGPGDQVLVSDLTFAASAYAIRYLGAEPVFIDCDRDSWNMSVSLLEEELAERCDGTMPKAVLAVDLYGQCPDYERICQVCARYGVPLVEDAAEALGATFRGRQAGTFGVMGVFSFNGNKIITTSGGGMLVTEERSLAKRARFLASQAREPVVHYEHRELGFNYRMSNLLAAVGRGQLMVLDERIGQRRAVNSFYRSALRDLPGLEFMPEGAGGRSNCWLTCITIDPLRFGIDRDTLRSHLDSVGIESRPVWKPMHLQPVFTDYRCRGGRVSADLFRRGLCLPSGSSLSAKELARVVNEILVARNRGRSTGTGGRS